MECGHLFNGVKWSAYSLLTPDSKTPSITIEDCPDGTIVNDKYLITYPSDESDISTKSHRNSFDDTKFNYYVNPMTGEVKEEIMREAEFEDYKLCGAVNDFDISLETGEAVPIVYLSTSRAAKLQRALRLAGLKKVSYLFGLRFIEK
ncbi:unnamed protein product [Leptosia nina]|uniref:Uncharacterized protein n=1 Tax=Leptosia nina TaxID=320188 RepID=A0AAV1J1T3_9NEOP